VSCIAAVLCWRWQIYLACTLTVWEPLFRLLHLPFVCLSHVRSPKLCEIRVKFCCPYRSDFASEVVKYPQNPKIAQMEILKTMRDTHRSTWLTAASQCLMLPVESTCDLPVVTSWPFLDLDELHLAVGPSQSGVRWHGTHCRTISVIHRTAVVALGVIWRLLFSRVTSVFSAIEMLHDIALYKLTIDIDIDMKFRHLYRKLGSPSKNMTSTFASDVAKYPRKPTNSPKWGSL